MAALPEGFDPTDPDVRQRGIQLQEFAELRKTAPVWWVEQTERARDGFLDTGFWAVTKHADIAAVSKNSADFSTSENGVIIRFQEGMTREQVMLNNALLINHDPPDHTKLRGIISRGFTPRAISELRDGLVEKAKEIVEEAKAKGSGDFVEDVACELPLVAIADLMGVPQEDRKKLFNWSNQMLAGEDPEYGDSPDVAAAEILGYAGALADERKREPKDDIVTKLITANVDGYGELSDDEFGFFFILLAVAGNETTRNSITHGMHAFFEHPDQWELWKKERPDTMVDEVIRWATPVSVFQRTALRDVEVGGVEVKKGQRVGMFYASGNHDEDVFENAHKFDISRSPNPHLAFGGHGAHYCIGANLARLQVDIMFNAIADVMPDIAPMGDPDRLRHSWINGVKHLPVRYN